MATQLFLKFSVSNPLVTSLQEHFNAQVTDMLPWASGEARKGVSDRLQALGHPRDLPQGWGWAE